MTKYTVVVEVTKTEEFDIEAENDNQAYEKAKEYCKLDYRNDFDIIDIYTEDE